jgi:hypothetical protein
MTISFNNLPPEMIGVICLYPTSHPLLYVNKACRKIAIEIFSQQHPILLLNWMRPRYFGPCQPHERIAIEDIMPILFRMSQISQLNLRHFRVACSPILQMTISEIIKIQNTPFKLMQIERFCKITWGEFPDFHNFRFQFLNVLFSELVQKESNLLKMSANISKIKSLVVFRESHKDLLYFELSTILFNKGLIAMAYEYASAIPSEERRSEAFSNFALCWHLSDEPEEAASLLTKVTHPTILKHWE